MNPDILLVEDVPQTVDGFSRDLTDRGAAVFLAPHAKRAREYLLENSWDLVLFDLRIPDDECQGAFIEVGVQLIRDFVAGRFDQIVRFGVITLQSVTPELEEFNSNPWYLGPFSKNEDPRRLYRLLERYELLDTRNDERPHEMPEERVRVKLEILERDPVSSSIKVRALSWGDEKFSISYGKLLPNLRSKVRGASLPAYIYCTVNAAAETPEALKPADFEGLVVSPGEPRVLLD